MTFDSLTSSQEVHQSAALLFTKLNVVMTTNAHTDPIKNGAVVDFSHGGRPRRHHFLEVEGITVRARVGIPTISTTDAKGSVIEPPPKPSRAQLWMRAAALNPEIGYALLYLEGKPSWTNLYKAYEAVRRLPSGDITKAEIKRFTQTANVAERHHPNKTIQPHPRPMELWEARSLITRWVSAAINEILAKNL